MKIHKDNPLWKCYLRFHKDSYKIPHPNNLCNFWWTAVFGLLAKLLIDWPFFISGLIITSFLILSGALSYLFMDYGAAYIPLVLTILIAIMFPCARLMCFVEKVDKKLGHRKVSSSIIWSFFAVACLTFLVTLILNFDQISITWNGIVMALLTLAFLAGVLLSLFLVWFVFMSVTKTQFAQTWIGFLKAKKQGICPLVEPPDDFDLENPPKAA